jgi:2-dehydropantoate 2-reductase
MKICLLGAGALGCAIGGTLAYSGAEVYLVNHDLAHVDAINLSGLALYAGSPNDVPRIVSVKAMQNCQHLGEMDLVIVLVKSYATRNAIESATHIIGKQTMVLSLQNGLGNEETLAAVVGREHIIAGRTYVGGVMLRPGHVIATTQGKLTCIGELDGRISPRLQQVKALFEQAGMAVTLSQNIVGEMWDKLLVNVATGAISGLTNLVYGEMYAIPEIEEVACAAVAEGIAVAQANGVRLSSTDPKVPWLKASAGLPYGFKTSMLQSLEKRRHTEVDYINGAVVRW